MRSSLNHLRGSRREWSFSVFSHSPKYCMSLLNFAGRRRAQKSHVLQVFMAFSFVNRVYIGRKSMALRQPALEMIKMLLGRADIGIESARVKSSFRRLLLLNCQGH